MINKKIDDNPINLIFIFRIIFRNKLFILALTSSATLLSIIYSLIQIPIYKGNFQILVQENGLSSSRGSSRINALLSGKGAVDDNKTQEYILKSPSVLKPVFNTALQEYKRRGDKGKIRYENWVENNLEIGFEEGTQVLTISFKDSEKDFILEILNLISNRYQNYSKQNKEKELTKTKNFLITQQKTYKKNAENSLKKLNAFSIRNGLGNLDGLYLMEPVLPSRGISNSPLGQVRDVPGSTENLESASQRYKLQFRALENYEAALAKYSSKLKPNSKLVQDLNTKIETLRESLKRPNEILLTHRELTTKAFLDESLKNNIIKQLEIVKLEIAKQRDPWELISEPTINKDRVSPQRKKLVFLGFASSLFIGILLTIWKEKKSGKVYELDELVKLLKCNFIDTLYLNNYKINYKIIENAFFKENKNQKTKEISREFNIIKFANENANLFIESCKFIEFNDKEIAENEDLIFLISPGMITLNQIILINKYIKIYPNKFIGWLFLNQ